MPMYDYECKAGHHVEKFYDMNGFPRSIKCPECGKRARKVLTSPYADPNHKCTQVQDSDPLWMKGRTGEAIYRAVYADDCVDERKPTTRSEMKAHLEKHRLVLLPGRFV